MSMIEQQLKEIRNMTSVLHDEKRYAAEEIMRQAADTIKALSAKLAAENMERSDRYYGIGWIACDDRLPKKDGFYLATIDGEIAGEDKPFSGLAEFENGKWVDDEDDYQCILAWQPLPEPYRP